MIGVIPLRRKHMPVARIHMKAVSTRMKGAREEEAR
jgi:hypothetical protein